MNNLENRIIDARDKANRVERDVRSLESEVRNLENRVRQLEQQVRAIEQAQS